VVEEATRKGKVSGSNPTGHEAHKKSTTFDFHKDRWAISQWAFSVIKILKIKKFLKAGDITEPSVEM